jgi:hypothetical protein
MVPSSPWSTARTRSTVRRSEASRGELTAHGEYVGIDYHRRRSLLVRRDESGASLGVARVVNDPLVLAAELAKAAPEPDVAIEATYGWVRHEALCDRVDCKDPPVACRSRRLKLEEA